MPDHERHASNPIRSRSGIALIGFLAIIGFLLTTEHRAHVLGVLPYALLLACPFLHMFHHSGHHGGPPDRPGSTVGASPHNHDASGGTT